MAQGENIAPLWDDSIVASDLEGFIHFWKC